MKSFTSILALAATATAQSLTDVLKSSNQTTSLQAAVAAAGLGSTLSGLKNITIFAPTNSAFDKFLAANGGASVLNNTALVRAVLQYHVLNATVKAAAITGSQVPLFPHTLLDNSTYENVTGGQYLGASVVNGSVQLSSGLGRTVKVVTADITYDGGVVHLIDEVLTIPATVAATAVASNLTSLAGALNTTNLLSAVNTSPNITIFAPTNAAFSAIQAAIANASTDTIASVLKYHVVPGAVVFSSQLSNGTKVATLNTGSILTITQVGSSFFVNGAAITKPNILVANGVVHLIDQVLNPGNNASTPTTSQTTGTNQFTSATPTTSQRAGNAAGSLKAYPVAAGVVAGLALLI